jgi:hypothetical protein
MRRMFITLIFITTAIIVNGQRSVDDLFNKYADNDGFVTISINGNLLKFVRSLDNGDENNQNYSWPEKITEIRILTQEKDDLKVNNFYDLVYRNLNRNQYEEFMRVKKSDQDLVMLVKTNGNRLKELILIAGGEDNVLIQIKGDMTMGEARKLSSEFKHDHDIDVISHWN